MITQKPISMRIKYETYWKIYQETMVSGMTRNEILNIGAILFLDLLDTLREYKRFKTRETKTKILKGFLKKWWPEIEQDQIL